MAHVAGLGFRGPLNTRDIMTALEMKRKPHLAKRLLKQSRGSWLITDPCLLGFRVFLEVIRYPENHTVELSCGIRWFLFLVLFSAHLVFPT